MPSPPDSDSEQHKQAKILLSNESPMLLVSSSSVDALNKDIESRGGDGVPDSAFRANVVVESPAGGPGEPAYSEDSWSRIRIGGQDFRPLGACRRCQMVCVNQATAERRQESYSTLGQDEKIGRQSSLACICGTNQEARRASLRLSALETRSRFVTKILCEIYVVAGISGGGMKPTCELG